MGEFSGSIIPISHKTTFEVTVETTEPARVEKMAREMRSHLLTDRLPMIKDVTVKPKD